MESLIEKQPNAGRGKDSSTGSQNPDKYRYGNFDRYYGSRIKGFERDPRLDVLPEGIFTGCSVLDIGCNAGYLTLSIARDFAPARILGIDIDPHLIGVARKNIRHYCSTTENIVGKFPGSLYQSGQKNHSQRQINTGQSGSNRNDLQSKNNFIPDNSSCDADLSDHQQATLSSVLYLPASSDGLSLPSTSPSSDSPSHPSSGNSLTGDIGGHSQTMGEYHGTKMLAGPSRNRHFPNNVWFLKENYVLESDLFLDMVREEYNVILALSVTKWIHLNWGDSGLRRFFQRTFRQLRSGGRLILEVQPFQSYYRRAKMLPEMLQTYRQIKLKPDQFRDYLLSTEVGFIDCEQLVTPQASSKGFQRPIFLFNKADYSEKKLSQSNDTSLNKIRQTNVLSEAPTIQAETSCTKQRTAFSLLESDSLSTSTTVNDRADSTTGNSQVDDGCDTSASCNPAKDVVPTDSGRPSRKSLDRRKRKMAVPGNGCQSE